VIDPLNIATTLGTARRGLRLCPSRVPDRRPNPR
jgi:hypothetical protein